MNTEQIFRNVYDPTSQTLKTTASQAGANVEVHDDSVSWGNNDPANTQKTIDIALPGTLHRDALYEIVVTDPSTESDLTVVVRNKHTFGGIARYPELTRFSVLKNNADGRAVLVQGWMLGEGARLVLSNDTLLGAAGAFTSYVHVRRV